MATLADSRAVKSLDCSSGRKRYKWQKSSERMDEIESELKRRSLDKAKPNPLEGSTFFKDCLVESRELCTAADFISFYEEILPKVQTMESVILHKELIVFKLVSGLQMEATLSLEAFFRLIAALSRDLLKDFIPFLPQIVNSLVTLLKNGGQKEPEIIKQIIIFWASLMREDLQKYLTCNIEGILRDTLALRYYPQAGISEKISMVMSSLLRSAPDEQLKKGIKRILSEVADPLNKDGGVSLLYYVMRGIPETLHSKAGQVLGFLLKDSTLSFCDNFPGSNSTVEAVSSTLQRLCEDFKAEELSVMWECLYKETKESVSNKKTAHLRRLLTVLTSAVRVQKDYSSLVGLLSQIVSTLMDSSETIVENDSMSDVLEKVWVLMLCTIDSPNVFSEMESIALQWAPIFSLKSSSLLTFLWGLLEKDKLIVKAFTSNILSSIENMILVSSEEIIPLLLSLCERQQTRHNGVNIIDESSESKYERIHEFLEENIKKIQTKIENTGFTEIDEGELAAVWGAVNCFPYFKVDSSLLICFKNTLKQHLAASVVNTFSAPELMWQSLLGAALRSCHKLRSTERFIHSDLEEALSLAKYHKSCVQVLSTVADYLDFVYRPLVANDESSMACTLLEANNAQDALDIFSENLHHSNKDVRLTTLRILCHFEFLFPNLSLEEHPPRKKLKTEVIQKSLPKINVLQLLHTIEKSPLTVSTQIELVSLIARIQMDVSACRIHEAYVPLVLNGMIGLFHNRYDKVQERASDCLAVLMEKHLEIVWNDFVHYLGQCHVKFESLHNPTANENYSISDNYTDLIGRFKLFLFPPSDSSPTATVVSRMLQTLVKVPTVAQSRASEILPVFLKFLGYNIENPVRVRLFNGGACKGEDWKKLLIQWLTLFKLMKNLRSCRFSLIVNDVLQNRLLDDSDAEIQTNVLECLVLWNDYLRPHCSHLKNLIKPKDLREELTIWNLSNDIEEAHRLYLVSLVIRILMPKVRSLKNSASRKHTSIRHRNAVLEFISRLDVNELSLFFALLVKPLNIISEEAMDLFCSSGKSSLDCFQKSNFLKYFTVDTISTLSRKKKFGLLHVIQHILDVFDRFHVRPFLDFLMGCVVRLLVYSAPNIDDERDINDSTNYDQAGTSLKQFKELRSLCLKIIARVLDKYEDCDVGSEFWDLFFSAVYPLIKSFKQEGSSSEKPSSLFSCFLSMSKSRKLVTFLCREEILIPDIFSMLTVTTASEAIKCSALKFIENMLSLENELDEDESMINGFLEPYIEELINSLHFFFLGDILKRKSVKNHGEREIKILKLLSKHIRDGCHVMKYLNILLSFLDKSVKDSDIHREALLAIQDITSLLGTESTSKIIKTVSPLLVDAEREVRLCICDLLQSLAKIDISLDLVAKCVSDDIRMAQQLEREQGAKEQLEPEESMEQKGQLVTKEMHGKDGKTDLRTNLFEEGGDDIRMAQQLEREQGAKEQLEPEESMEQKGQLVTKEMHGKDDDLDYETIINAYGKIDADFFNKSSEQQMMIILSQSLYNISSKEVTLKDCAYNLLCTFIEFSASILCQEASTHSGIGKEVLNSDASWTGDRVLRVMNKFILKHIGDAVNRGISSGKEEILLVRKMVTKLPDAGNLAAFRPLCSENSDVDFFKNMFSIQRHRKANAIKCFAKVAKDSSLPEGVVRKLLVSAFFNMLLDGKNGKDGKDRNVQDACNEALASVSAHMSWKSYYALLNRCFREMKKHTNTRKILLQLICLILNNFHFSKDGCTQEAVEIRTYIEKSVFPKIQRLMDCDSDRVNVHCYVAALKVLKLLPNEKMDAHLESVVPKLCSYLKSELESTCDEARKALAACLEELGLDYLQFVINGLRARLKRGSEVHVLGYTVNFILSKCLFSSVNGKLDHCLGDLLNIVESDIFGDVDEQEKERKFSKNKKKETKKCKSFETLKLIAGNVTFKSHAVKLLSPVTRHLQRHLIPKLSKLERMLSYIAAGIESNPSVDQQDFFCFVQNCVYDGMNNRIVYRDQVSCNKKSKSRDVQETAGTTSCPHLITVFALNLLHNRLKKMNLNNTKTDKVLLSMLKPFVKLLVECLSSRYEDVVSSSVKCFTELLRLQLSSLISEADKVNTAVLTVAQSAMSSRDLGLMLSCRKLLTALLKEEAITLSSEQLEMLIHSMFVDLEPGSDTNSAITSLSLVKAILRSKKRSRLSVEKVDDIVIPMRPYTHMFFTHTRGRTKPTRPNKRVSAALIRTSDKGIRKNCIKLLLDVFTHYTPSKKGLERRINTLLNSLRYEHASGREAALDMLQVLIQKFSKHKQSVLDQQSQHLFLQLADRLGTDDNKKVQSNIGDVIKLLICKNKVDSNLQLCLDWYKEEGSQAKAAQVLGLFVEAKKKAFPKHICSILLQQAKKILESAIHMQDTVDGEGRIPFWKEAYFSLVAIEKLFKQFPDLCFEKELEDVWKMVFKLLLHRHEWLETISCRLLDHYCTALAGRKRGKSLTLVANSLLEKPSSLFMIAASLCFQLEVQRSTGNVNDDVDRENVITGNIVFAVSALHTLIGQSDHWFWSNLDNDEQGEFLTAFQVLDSGKGKSTFLALTSGQHSENDVRNVLVESLLKRMGKIALEMDSIQTKIVFNVYKHFASQLNQEDCRLYAHRILLPLYKVCQGYTGRVFSDKLKHLAEEVRDSIRDTSLGSQMFVQVYSEIKKSLETKREKRKREEKLMAVINPERNAKRKLKLASKNKANKKRKIMSKKMDRWARS